MSTNKDDAASPEGAPQQGGAQKGGKDKGGQGKGGKDKGGKDKGGQGKGDQAKSESKEPKEAPRRNGSSRACKRPTARKCPASRRTLAIRTDDGADLKKIVVNMASARPSRTRTAWRPQRRTSLRSPGSDR
jgi:hypothetical protein